MTTSTAAPHEAARLLRTYLSERGWSMERLAEELDWKPEAVRDLFDGRTSMDLGTVEPVLQALDVSPLEFFRRLYGSESPSVATEDDADEPLSRDEVEALVTEMRKRLQGARRSLEAREMSTRRSD